MTGERSGEEGAGTKKAAPDTTNSETAKVTASRKRKRLFKRYQASHLVGRFSRLLVFSFGTGQIQVRQPVAIKGYEKLGQVIRSYRRRSTSRIPVKMRRMIETLFRVLIGKKGWVRGTSPSPSF